MDLPGAGDCISVGESYVESFMVREVEIVVAHFVG